MKKVVFLAVFTFLFFFKQTFAIHFSGSNDYKILEIKNQTDASAIYIPNYKNQKFLLYKSHFVYQDSDAIGVMNETSDILLIVFACGQKDELLYCGRFFNRRTNQMSAIIPNMLDSNFKQNIVAYYNQIESSVVLTPFFEKCKQPLTYKIKIYPDTDFGTETKFLDNGNLQLDYVNSKNKDVIDVIPINYQQLYKDCGTHA